jgi:hypothetical protein
MSLNRNQQYTLVAAAALLLGDLALWGATGFNLLTRQQVPVAMTDELLGTSYIVWRNVFIVGLDIAGPAAAGIAALGALLLRVFRPRT